MHGLMVGQVAQVIHTGSRVEYEVREERGREITWMVVLPESSSKKIGEHWGSHVKLSKSFYTQMESTEVHRIPQIC